MVPTVAAPVRGLARSTWQRVGGDGRLGLTLLCALRVFFGVFAIAVLASTPRPAVEGNWIELVIQGGEPWSWFLSAWQRWDALWYQKIALEGYGAGPGLTAFFPFYPLLSGILSTIVFGQIVLAQLLISSAAFVVVIVLLRRLTRMELGTLPATPTGGSPQVARVPIRVDSLVVLLTVSFPSAFFLLAPYTESLFLVLTLGAFYLARNNRPWAAGAIGVLASLTRGQGVLLVLPLAWEQFRRRSTGERRLDPRLLASLLPMLGIVSFSLYVQLIVGEQKIGLGALDVWGYRQVAPWDAVGTSWSYISEGWAGLRPAPAGPAPSGIEALNLLSLVGFSVLALIAARKLPLSYALYAGASLAPLWTRTMWYSPLMSTSRYCLVIFPCFMVASAYLARRPRLALGWLGTSVALQLVLFEIWVQWGFVA